MSMVKEKCFAKATWRTVVRGTVSFISIVVIVLLCVSVFLGLNYASFDLARNASANFSVVPLEPNETGTKQDNTRGTLDAGWTALAAGERELEERYRRLEETGKKLEDTEIELEDTRKKIEDSQARLEETKTELQTAKSELVTDFDRLVVSRAELDKGKKELEDDWSELEDAKTRIRAIVWEAVEDACGGTPDGIVWAGEIAADADDSSAEAMDFWLITAYRCDLNLSLEENIKAVIYSDQVTDELLREAYIAATGTKLGFSARLIRALLAEAAVKEAEAYQGDYAALQSACRQWDEEHAEYLKGLDAYRKEESQYQSDLEKYCADMDEYRAGLALLEAEKAQYEEKKRQYGEALAQYGQEQIDAEVLRKELEESRKRLEDGERELEDGLEAYSGAALDGNDAAVYAKLLTIADSLRRLGNALALLFIPVVALMIFAVIRRMLVKRRTPDDAAKATGSFTAELFWKHLIFGVSATLLGAALGILAARFAAEGLVLKGYDLYYTFDLTDRTMPVLPTLGALASAASLAVIAVWSACFSAARARGASDAAQDP